MILSLRQVNKFAIIAILMYPVFIAIVNLNLDNEGLTISKYYFFLILVLGFIVMSFSVKVFYLKKSNVLGYVSLSLILVIALLNFTTFRYSMPVFFLVYLIFLLRISEFGGLWTTGLIRKVGLLYLVFSLIYLFLGSSFEFQGRFSGFSDSSTTYSIFIITIVLLLIRTNLSIYYKGIIYVIGIILVAITLTRLNLAFYLLIPFFILVSRANPNRRSLFIIIYVVLLNLVYPIYNTIAQRYPEIIEVRYADGKDASFGLRIALFNEVYSNWNDSEPWNKYFGNGLEDARQHIIELHKLDLLPHNDFMRILNDFGLIPSILFLIWLVRIINSNRTTFILGLLYFLSFYHNMVYNLYIISIIVLCSYKDPFERRHFHETQNLIKPIFPT
jgi:O-Antigen ligase